MTEAAAGQHPSSPPRPLHDGAPACLDGSRACASAAHAHTQHDTCRQGERIRRLQAEVCSSLQTLKQSRNHTVTANIFL